MRYATYTFWLLVYTNIAIADLFSGSNSIDQVFFGTTLGLWLGYFCNAFLRKPLEHHTTKLLNGEYHATGYRRLLKVLLAIVVSDTLIMTALFSIVDSMQVPESWTA